jgi:broad specificity phosphatase PhoE
MDVELTDAAKEDAQALQQKLPVYLPVHTSDLRRSKQTGWYISTGVQWHKELRPWNVGIMAGKPTELVHPRLVLYYESSNVRVPFGESFDEFVKRFLGFMYSLQDDCILVTHFRNCKLLQAWAAADYLDIDMSVMKRDDVQTLDILTFDLPKFGSDTKRCI